MKPLCEYMINEMLPGFRALVAKKLMEDHGLSQTEVAELLDTTQPAISQYRRQLRGKKTSVFMKNHELLDFLDSDGAKDCDGQDKAGPDRPRVLQGVQVHARQGHRFGRFHVLSVF